MANIITPVQALAVMTEAYKQSTGRTDIDTIDATNFANVAALVTGSESVVMDNFVGTINLMLFDTVFAIREYDEKIRLMQVTKEQWGAAFRKISFLWKEGDEVSFRNTDQHTTVFKDGETIDMYTIKKGECITMFITRLLYNSKEALQHCFLSEGRLCDNSNELDYLKYFWLSAIYTHKRNPILHGCPVRDSIRLYNHWSKYIKRCGSVVLHLPVLAKFY